MHCKQPPTKQFKKQEKQLVIWLAIKLLKKITKASRTSLQNSSETVTNKAENIRLDRDIPTKRYIYIYFKQQNIIDDLRLI